MLKTIKINIVKLNLHFENTFCGQLLVCDY